MIILDTDHLIEFEKGSSDAAARLQSRLLANGDEIATTIVSVEEVLRGWLAEIHRRTDPRLQVSAYSHLERFVDFVADWDVLRGIMPQ
jgi:predicted nucleic acid-binding protein